MSVAFSVPYYLVADMGVDASNEMFARIAETVAVETGVPHRWSYVPMEDVYRLEPAAIALEEPAPDTC